MTAGGGGGLHGHHGGAGSMYPFVQGLIPSRSPHTVLPCNVWPRVAFPTAGHWQGQSFPLSSPPAKAGDPDGWWLGPVCSFLDLGGLTPFRAQLWDLAAILGPQEKSAGFPFTTMHTLVYCTSAL